MSGNGTPDSFSLEDVLVSLKGSSVDSSKCKMKNVMTRSSSRIKQIRCKVVTWKLCTICGIIQRSLYSVNSLVSHDVVQLSSALCFSSYLSCS